MVDKKEPFLGPLSMLSKYERELLYQNKRLRDDLIKIANSLKPDWREKGFTCDSSWILEEIQHLDQDKLNLERTVGNLLEVLAHYESKSNAP